MYVESITISRDCPISKKPIRIPVRGIHCNHLQCFDLESYLYLNLVRSLWRCPICFSNTIFEKLEVDDFIMQINTLSESYGCSKLEVRSDSKWRPISESTRSPNVTNNVSYTSNVMTDANNPVNNINQNQTGDIDSYNHKQILSSTLSNPNSNLIHSDNSTLPSSQEILDINKNSPPLQNDGDAQGKNHSDQVNLDNFDCRAPNESNVLLKSISGLSNNPKYKNLDDEFELQGSVVSNGKMQADLNCGDLIDTMNKYSNIEDNSLVDTSKDGIGKGLDEKLGPYHLTELAASDAKHFKSKEDIDQFDEKNVELDTPCNIDTSKDVDNNIVGEVSNVSEWNYQHLENLMLTNTLAQSPTQNSPAMNNALNSIKLDADDPIESLLMKNNSKHINADINLPESNINKSNEPLRDNSFDIIKKVKKPTDTTERPEPDSPHDASQIIPAIGNTINCDESTKSHEGVVLKEDQINSNIASSNTNNVYLIPQNNENQDLKGDQILVDDFSSNSMGMYDLNETNDIKIISPEQKYLCNFINDTQKSDPGDLLNEDYKKTNINTNETTLGNIVESNLDPKHCNQFLNDEYPLNSPDNDFNNFIM
ncbi:MAG: Zinc finger MIZ domain-containing protein 1 [Marteilia pararefringens]